MSRARHVYFERPCGRPLSCKVSSLMNSPPPRCDLSSYVRVHSHGNLYVPPLIRISGPLGLLKLDVFGRHICCSSNEALDLDSHRLFQDLKLAKS